MISWFKRRASPAALRNHGVRETHDQDGLAAATALVDTLYGPATSGSVIAAVRQAGFSEEAYFQANPDLRPVFPGPARALLHFLAMVKIERRGFPITLHVAGLAAIHALPTDDRTMIAGLLASLADAATFMGTAPRPEVLHGLWPVVRAAGRLGGHAFVIIGDDNASLYRRSAVQGADWLLPLHVCCGGGSAIGLGEPHSRSGHGRQVRALIESLPGAETGNDIPILIRFGQVDLEFVQPLRRSRQGGTCFDQGEFEAFAAASVSAYAAFLVSVVPPARRAGVVVLGVFPPVVTDETLRRGHIDGGVANAAGINDPDALQAAFARLEWPDLATRTRLHAAYNARLEEAVCAAGFRFAADFDGLLSRDGVLDQRYIAAGNGRDHHLDFALTETLLTNTIWRLLQPDRPVPRIGFADLAEMPDPALLPRLDRPGLDVGALSPDQAAWARDGVVIKRGFLPDALLDPYIARRAAFRPGTAWNAVGWPDGNCYEGVPELRDVALYPPLMVLLNELIGEPMLFHLALTGWLSTERDWHQDDYLNPDFINTWYCAVWIALDTVTPQSGPFEYVPGSQRWPLLRGEKVRSFLTDEERGRKAATTKLVEWPKYAERFLSPAIEAQIEASGLPVVPFYGRKGDVLVWHSRLMHRGSKRLEAWDTVGGKIYSRYPRKSLITHYSGINHRPDMLAREQDGNGQSYAVFNTVLTLD